MSVETDRIILLILLIYCICIELRNSKISTDAESTVVTIDVEKPPQNNGVVVEVKIPVSKTSIAIFLMHKLVFQRLESGSMLDLLMDHTTYSNGSYFMQ